MASDRRTSLHVFFTNQNANGGTQVDCRRTDRNQPIYAVPTTPTVPRALGEEENGRKSEKGEWEDDEEEGGMASLNRESFPPSQISMYQGLMSFFAGYINKTAHIAALRTILMTYHTFSPELGYVQGQFFHKPPCLTPNGLFYLILQACQIC